MRTSACSSGQCELSGSGLSSPTAYIATTLLTASFAYLIVEDASFYESGPWVSGRESVNENTIKCDMPNQIVAFAVYSSYY